MTRHTSSGSTSGWRSIGVGRGDPRLVGVALAAVGGDLDDVLDRGEPLAQALRPTGSSSEPTRSIRRAGVVDGVVDLVGGRAPVDDRVGRAEQRGGHGELDAGRVVLVEEGHDVAAARSRRPAAHRPRAAPGRTTAPTSRCGPGRSSPRRRGCARPSGPGGRSTKRGAGAPEAVMRPDGADVTPGDKGAATRWTARSQRSSPTHSQVSAWSQPAGSPWSHERRRTPAPRAVRSDTPSTSPPPTTPSSTPPRARLRSRRPRRWVRGPTPRPPPSSPPTTPRPSPARTAPPPRPTAAPGPAGASPPASWPPPWWSAAVPASAAPPSGAPLHGDDTSGSAGDLHHPGAQHVDLDLAGRPRRRRRGGGREGAALGGQDRRVAARRARAPARGSSSAADGPDPHQQPRRRAGRRRRLDQGLLQRRLLRRRHRARHRPAHRHRADPGRRASRG